MTSQEFVLWLKGFSEGVHEYNITPKQWDILKDKLAEVKDDTTSSPFPFGVPNNPPFVTLPHITPAPLTNPYNPYKPYEVYCGEKPSNDPYDRFKTWCGDTSGTSLTTSSGSGAIYTTTPGTTGYITIANPYLASFTTGSATYNPSTTTRWNPSGSNWSYTDMGGNNRWKEHQAKMADYIPYQPYTTGGEDEVIKHHNED
jgi:hypothetical protein